MSRSVIFGLVSAAAVGVGPSALGGGTPETWMFDLSTQGEDVFWTSPTSVDPTADEYDLTLEIMLVEASVTFQGIPFGPVDVTNEIPEEDRTIMQTVAGPAPVTIADEMILFPPPPDPVTFAGDVELTIDAAGFGQLSLTNVTLGTADVDLGGIFGVQTVQLTEVRVAGTATVTPRFVCVGDLDGDGQVGASDLAIVLGDWGGAGAGGSDLDGSGSVGAGDLAILLGNWGPCA